MLLNDTMPPDLFLPRPAWCFVKLSEGFRFIMGPCIAPDRFKGLISSHRNMLKALVVLWCHLTRQQNIIYLEIQKTEEMISKEDFLSLKNTYVFSIKKY